MSTHLEWRHKYLPPWGYILSFETGTVASALSDMKVNDLVASIGTGLRWQVSSDKPLHLGLDVGVSKDNHAVYVQIGEKF